MQKYYISSFGYERLNNEVRNLELSIKETANEIEAARELGDLSENAEYHAAKAKQASNMNLLARYEDYLNGSEVISEVQDETIVQFGATVTLTSNANQIIKVRIVGEYECSYDDEDKVKKISVYSPLGKSLIGLSLKDSTTIATQSYNISEIDYSYFKKHAKTTANN